MDVHIFTRDVNEAPALSSEELAELEAGIAKADQRDMISGEECFQHLRYG